MAIVHRNFNGTKTECKHGHPFSGENLYYRDGRRRCRACYRETVKRTYWRYKMNDPEKYRSKRLEWNHNGKARNPGRDRNRALKYHYGMTLAGYKDLFLSQNGACAICGRTGLKLVVDHDHSCCPGEITCGKCIRGLLCSKCNTAVGRFDENPKRLERAAEYLRGKAAQ